MRRSITDSPCEDPTCYRGGVGEWNYQYKDGPCAAQPCHWPWQYLDVGTLDGWVTIPHSEVEKYARAGHSIRRLPPRPHFTDTPSEPIVDAGKLALRERKGLPPYQRPPLGERK